MVEADPNMVAATGGATLIKSLFGNNIKGTIIAVIDPAPPPPPPPVLPEAPFPPPPPPPMQSMYARDLPMGFSQRSLPLVVKELLKKSASSTLGLLAKFDGSITRKQ
jgi:hypothetical protein